MIFVLITVICCLSWKCQFNNFGEISKTHFLYKEDNVNEVKWLEKYEYCRAKGDTNVYNDAGQGKCEYSRGLCYWNNGICENTNRNNDPFLECQELMNNNILVEGLDNGRKPVIESVTKSTSTELSKETQILPNFNGGEDRVSSSNKINLSLGSLFFMFL